MPVLFCYEFNMPGPVLHGLYYQLYSYAETSGFGLSWLLAIVPFSIGPKYEFVFEFGPKQSKTGTPFPFNTI